MTEIIVTGEEVTTAVLEELRIDEYNSVRVFDRDREVMLHDLKVVIYNEDEDEDLEKFECEDCGCYFMVEDRDSFECPNCQTDNNSLKEVALQEVTASRTLHGLENGLAYYNYEGVHFRVFKSFKDGELWLDTGDDDYVIAEFDCEDALENYLINKTKAYEIKAGNRTYFVKEYKAGEFGIYDEKDKLQADCFESIEHAQEWFDKEIKINKKLKVLNDAIFATLDNDDAMIDIRPCVYCKENNSTHFLCDSCGAGMCDDCYDSHKEHTEHYHVPLEECEGKHIDLIKKVCNCDDPQYICETCMKKALSLTPEDFAKEANKILEGTNLRAVIIETSELYGEDGDVDEYDPYYMQPMYEGYLEDITNEEEIDNARTGRYCSLESVSKELEGFAQDRKIGFIANESKKLTGTRWKDKESLENHLKELFKIDPILDDVDESGLVSDYAFIGSIFQDYGYLDIYYLKIPFNKAGREETIYITEVNVSFE
ncbi:hypothetical protein [Sulfurimonas indica]|uniref:hypothetical protein n=1 Tax=Sulfurimonas TaxID=202746 RepID=UPI001264E388|nr:hypothetical protein [Sulfurimonas indica]